VAKGYDVVFVLALTVGGAAASPMAEAFRRQLEAELDVVRQGGSHVELIVPDAASLEAFGMNLMDHRRRPPAAKAGVEQGRGQAGKLERLWRTV
jgi:NTE family protein